MMTSFSPRFIHSNILQGFYQLLFATLPLVTKKTGLSMTFHQQPGFYVMESGSRQPLTQNPAPFSKKRAGLNVPDFGNRFLITCS